MYLSNKFPGQDEDTLEGGIACDALLTRAVVLCSVCCCSRLTLGNQSEVPDGALADTLRDLELQRMARGTERRSPRSIVQVHGVLCSYAFRLLSCEIYMCRSEREISPATEGRSRRSQSARSGACQSVLHRCLAIVT